MAYSGGINKQLEYFSRRPACLLLIAVLSAVPAKVFAYRPFVSTDADVVEAGEIEIEFGYFNWERANRENSYVTPQLVFNYGLSNTLELIGEFELEHVSGESSQLVDPGLFLKKVFKPGVLQGSPGVSFAVEAGLLLPSAIDEEDQTGFEAFGILSGTAANFTWHLNLGGGVDRANHDAFALWGVILEHPVTSNLKLVAEFNGESLRNEAAENSGLLGMVWESSAIPGLTLDLGIRHGSSRAAPDWGATMGLSYSF
ncbi:MAG: hypothetical protein QGG54_05305 [Gammaproteobacteria bacterium]|jgi:hypothetical protein|nr:hypothetical protein [Gammaproteobacteria bacterium]MDP6536117.1 hypothetical protein [Gammaproteobacteria bacterium]MDP6732509.1 hypothetical protein [Gammaproteobacteria bacterium]HAJ77340.1 hypothetical protein [Gammaproteobacteria bacterium]